MAAQEQVSTDGLLSHRAAAKRLKISEGSLYTYALRGKIEGIIDVTPGAPTGRGNRNPRVYRFHPSALEAYEQKRIAGNQNRGRREREDTDEIITLLQETDLTLEQIGSRKRLSRERIRQISTQKGIDNQERVRRRKKETVGQSGTSPR